jgi:DNA helicase-2/ATP-dependent DNA helicase PcrA
MAIDVFKGMNEFQREAIAAIDGPLLVVAGAGSGKTRVITHRIANIIQHGVRPDRVLAITFTNKAAGEMKERIERLIGLQTPWITTFHSAGLRIMKLEMARLGFQHPFSVLDEDAQKRLFRRIYKELKLDPKVIDPRKITWRISQWKNQLENIEKFEANDDLDIWAQKCHELYARICQEECMVDFDDLLVKPVRMFEADEELRQKYIARFPYILVDEFQDTNTVQYRLLRLLSDHRNICATGDPDQAIYGWRGADISNIMNFEQDFAPCKKVLLEQNYRSTKVVLRAAQGVVERNTNRIDKVIRTDNDEGKPLSLLAVDDEMDESLAIAAAVDRMRKQGKKLADMAVFYRTNAQSRVLEDGLRRREIPYRIVGGTRFFDRAEVRDVMAYLKLLVNPLDRTSFERIANVPARGLGDATLNHLFTFADEHEQPFHELLVRDEWLERVAVGRAAKPLRELSRTWRMLRALPLGSPAACARGIIELTSIEKHYRDADEPGEAEERIANVREVVSAAEQYHEIHPEGGLPGFLEHVALVTDADAAAAEQGESIDLLTLMTLHAAKGLEFDHVFITGCEEGVFPLARMGECADLEEERRLMYVGITRAKKELYLSRARCRMMYGQTFRNEPSMFLSEIPSDCFESRDATGRLKLPTGEHVRGTAKQELARDVAEENAELTGAAAMARAMQLGVTAAINLKDASRKEKKAYFDAPVALPDDPFISGERIIHSTLGAGEVVAMKGPAGNRAIVVAFDQHGKKELLWSFCAGKVSRE